MLKVDTITVAYGAIKALKGLTLSVGEGEIVALIGANGAGKTTTLRTISGLLHPREGQIFFKGENITKAKPHHIVQAGISHAPEGRGIFSNLSVEDNLALGAYVRKDSREKIKEDYDKVYGLFPILKQRRKQLAGTRSGGEQQMLTISRALMAMPKLLLLDEPSLGLAPQIIIQIFRVIRELNEKGMTVLLVEQNANMALHSAHKAYVIETGKIALQGKASDLLNHPDVKKAYLGS